MRKTYSEDKLRQIFNKGKIFNDEPNQWRLDRYGRKMMWGARGQAGSNYEWQVHHRDGNSRNNNINNLEPVNWETHRELH